MGRRNFVVDISHQPSSVGRRQGNNQIYFQSYAECSDGLINYRVSELDFYFLSIKIKKNLDFENSAVKSIQKADYVVYFIQKETIIHVPYL